MKNLLIFTYAFALACNIKLFLYIFKLKHLQKALTLLARLAIKKRGDLRRLVHVLQKVEAHFPKNNCLTMALMGHCLLKQMGYDSQIHFGAKLNDNKELQAHAWLTYQNKYLIVGRLDNLQDFKKFS